MLGVDTKRIAQCADLVKDLQMAFKINWNRWKASEHGASHNCKIGIVPEFGVVDEVSRNAAVVRGEASDYDVSCGGCTLVDMGRSDEDATVPNGKRGAVYIRERRTRLRG